MGMEARNRSLPDWFTRIRTGQLKLPRFQRFESWSHAEVVTLLDSVIRGRPVGSALVLETGDHCTRGKNRLSAARWQVHPNPPNAQQSICWMDNSD